MPEVWREVEGFEGKYAVSSLGRVKRLAHVCELRNRWGTLSRRPMPEMMLKLENRRGYLGVGLWVGGLCKIVRVSVLVCSAFHGPKPFVGAITLHGDGNSQNNDQANLRWGTDLDNAADRTAHGRTARGIRQHSAKLDDERVVNIRQRHRAGHAIRALAREFGVAQGTIQRVVRGTTWAHVPG